MFHVKLRAVLPALLVTTAFGVTPQEASAGISKCTGSDGKVTFSDRSCPAGLAAVAIRPLPISGKASPTTSAVAPRGSSGSAGAGGAPTAVPGNRVVARGPCTDKRRGLDDRRAVSAVEAEVARDCR